MDNGCLSAPLRTRAPRFLVTLVLDAGSRRSIKTQAAAGHRCRRYPFPFPIKPPRNYLFPSQLDGDNWRGSVELTAMRFVFQSVVS